MAIVKSPSQWEMFRPARSDPPPSLVLWGIIVLILITCGGWGAVVWAARAESADDAARFVAAVSGCVFGFGGLLMGLGFWVNRRTLRAALTRRPNP